MVQFSKNRVRYVLASCYWYYSILPLACCPPRHQYHHEVGIGQPTVDCIELEQATSALFSWKGNDEQTRFDPLAERSIL